MSQNGAPPDQPLPVLKQRQPTDHVTVRPRGCLVTGCEQDPKFMVICPPHFGLLPVRLSAAVWNEYRESWLGGNHPSSGYKQALRAAVDWLEENTEIPSG